MAKLQISSQPVCHFCAVTPFFSVLAQTERPQRFIKVGSTVSLGVFYSVLPLVLCLAVSFCHGIGLH